MPEALIYRVHRYSLVINILGAVLTGLMLRRLLSDGLAAVFSIVSVFLFVVVFLGEDRAYTWTAILGAIEIGTSGGFYVLYSAPVYAVLPLALTGIILMFTGFGCRSRFTRARERKQLSDFVPPAFG